MKDIKEIGKKVNINFISVPYVTKKEDIAEVKKNLKGTPAEDALIFSRVEDKPGVSEFYSINDSSDGVIIPRRSLGLSLLSEKLYSLQKYLFEQGNLGSKPVIICDSVIDSMITEPKPDRREIADL